MTRSTLRRAGLLTAALTLVITGCGSDDPAADSPAPSDDTSSAAPEPTDATSEPGSGESSEPAASGPFSATVEALATLADPPGVSYANRDTNTYYFANGTTMPLPDVDYFQVSVVEPYVFMTHSVDEGSLLTAFSKTGVQKWTRPISGPFAVSEDHTVLAWASPTGEIHTWTAGDGDVQLTPQPAGVEVDAVTGSDSCLEANGSHCRVYFHKYSESPKNAARVTDSHGITDIVTIGNTVLTSDVNAAGDTLIWRSVSGTGTCSEAMTLDGSLFETCDYLPSAFAPGGAPYIAAYPPYLDGLGTGQLYVLSTDGSLVGEINSTSNGFMGQMRWEDSTHLLVVGYDAGFWSIYRIDVETGEVTKAVKNAEADEVSNPFVIAS